MYFLILHETVEEEEYSEAPIAVTKPTNTENVGVQFMITNKMRRVLEGQLGYLPSEVDDMDPQVALYANLLYRSVLMSSFLIRLHR